MNFAVYHSKTIQGEPRPGVVFIGGSLRTDWLGRLKCRTRSASQCCVVTVTRSGRPIARYVLQLLVVLCLSWWLAGPGPQLGGCILI